MPGTASAPGWRPQDQRSQPRRARLRSHNEDDDADDDADVGAPRVTSGRRTRRAGQRRQQEQLQSSRRDAKRPKREHGRRAPCRGRGSSGLRTAPLARETPRVIREAAVRSCRTASSPGVADRQERRERRTDKRQHEDGRGGISVNRYDADRKRATPVDSRSQLVQAPMMSSRRDGRSGAGTMLSADMTTYPSSRTTPGWSLSEPIDRQPKDATQGDRARHDGVDPDRHQDLGFVHRHHDARTSQGPATGHTMASRRSAPRWRGRI